MPKTVKISVILLCISLFISSLLGLLELKLGVIGQGEFLFALFILALYCIIPYFLSKGSNGAKWTFLVLNVLSLFALIGLGFKGLDVNSNLEKLNMMQSLFFSSITLFLLFIPEESRYYFSK